MAGFKIEILNKNVKQLLLLSHFPLRKWSNGILFYCRNKMSLNSVLSSVQDGRVGTGTSGLCGEEGFINNIVRVADA